ncbi:MAG TPA: CUAEP/CCAEP-tail radical SAM protein [Vicinamibacterales bacterium]|nr:CUAEP/CCAEP-tail radical SAM protein [Vicinamibacterales bacterium]
MTALLVSAYELGHQPFGLASPAAWLRRDGVDVRTIDLTKDTLADADLLAASFIGFHLAMHTATRLASPVIRRARAMNPSARICAYGLYAPLNEEWLRSLGVDHVIGGEFEERLASLAREPEQNPPRVVPAIPKLRFLVPDRTGLPPLSRYATLILGDGTRRTVGYTEASRGCRHLCRHCPIVPVYNGEFRVVQPEVVLADVDAQIDAGAAHITFGDPDFFNGPTHAMRIVEALHARHPAVTYDATIKVEHLLQHRDLLPRLGATGCLFITSAVESVDDGVLARLDKGHTRQDFEAAVSICAQAGVTLAPTFVAFHPWLSLDGYCELLDTIERLGLVSHVAPIQLAIRLLIPLGSRLLELEDVRHLVGAFDPNTLAYPWAHPDPRVDVLHRDVTALVGSRLVADRGAVFDEISHLAHERAGTARPVVRDRGAHVAVPAMSEPWYCCAEPNPDQLRVI